MLLHRSFVDGLAHASYLLACERTKLAAIIDPQRDVEPYLARASELGVRIAQVWITHLHADFVAGHLELKDRCDAEILIGAAAEAAFAHRKLAHGDEFTLGDLRVRAIATPGHTPESMCFLVRDTKSGEQQLFTGDTLFVGDVGRPDLFGAEKAKELARSLYASITRQLFPLGDAVTVAPAHGAGSLCGKNVSAEPFSTLGKERAGNCAIAGKDEDAFVKALLDGIPEAPPIFARNARVNREGPALLRTLPLPRGLSADEVEHQAAAGVLVVDVRPADAFKLGHIPGSLFLGQEASSHTWASWLIPHDQELILLTSDSSGAQEAMRKLRRVGIDRITGFVNCGIDAWERAGKDVGCLRDLAPRDLQRLRELRDAPRLVDVRQPAEWLAGHAPDATHAPLPQVGKQARQLAKEGPVAVMCAGGYRSVIACSVLMRAGKADLVNVPGGFRAWAQAGLPVSR